MTYEGLADRVARVRERIERAQARAGRSGPVTIVAVTKGHDVAAVRAALGAGLADIGENRVQEALAKQDALGDVAARWHLIGSLQRNKARHAVGRFVLIHSVDRLELATELSRRVPPGIRQRILVEVNCSGEAQKGGVPVEAAVDLVGAVRDLPGLELRGLMTMAALTDEPGVQRAAFGRLARIAETLAGAGAPVAELSMGMSGDFEVAVEEGATMVRLGTLLFGERL